MINDVFHRLEVRQLFNFYKNSSLNASDFVKIHRGEDCITCLEENRIGIIPEEVKPLLVEFWQSTIRHNKKWEGEKRRFC